MRWKCVVALVAVSLFAAAVAQAGVLRVVVVQTSDLAGYAKALDSRSSTRA